MFVTSISMLNNSTYLPGAFQLKNDYLKPGPPCLCLPASLELAVLEHDVGPASVSLITITAAMAA